MGLINRKLEDGPRVQGGKKECEINRGRGWKAQGRRHRLSRSDNDLGGAPLTSHVFIQM